MMIKKAHYKTVFISDIHLGNPKNQSDKLIKFLNSITFENLVIVGDFIDFWQLRRFGKRTKKEQETLNYINNLAQNGVKITYIQGNHDRKLKCSKKIQIENMTICREIYYKTQKGKTYYVTHGDCMDGVNNNWLELGQIGSITSGMLQKFEYLWNKNVYDNSCISLAEKLEEWIKKNRMPEKKVKNKVKKFSKNMHCDGIILGHFHFAMHYEINGLDFFCTGDWLKHFAAVVEDSNGDLELISYKDSELFNFG